MRGLLETVRIWADTHWHWGLPCFSRLHWWTEKALCWWENLLLWLHQTCQEATHHFWFGLEPQRGLLSFKQVDLHQPWHHLSLPLIRLPASISSISSSIVLRFACIAWMSTTPKMYGSALCFLHPREYSALSDKVVSAASDPESLDRPQANRIPLSPIPSCSKPSVWRGSPSATSKLAFPLCEND
jgi:hypothetical protein